MVSRCHTFGIHHNVYTESKLSPGLLLANDSTTTVLEHAHSCPVHDSFSEQYEDLKYSLSPFYLIFFPFLSPFTGVRHDSWSMSLHSYSCFLATSSFTGISSNKSLAPLVLSACFWENLNWQRLPLNLLFFRNQIMHNILFEKEFCR